MSVTGPAIDQMKMGAVPKKCPTCGKELVQMRSLVAHWRMGICERHIASLMARELTGGIQVWPLTQIVSVSFLAKNH